MHSFYSWRYGGIRYGTAFKIDNIGIERNLFMNASEFISELQGRVSQTNLASLSSPEFFETPEGKDILHFLAGKVTVIDEKSFQLVDDEVTKVLAKEPSYAGRDFFQDMAGLGFSCKCTSYHQDEAPIRTYLFQAN